MRSLLTVALVLDSKINFMVKSTNREYHGASFVDKSTLNFWNTICNTKIQMIKNLMNPWNRLGLQIHLAQDQKEQNFVNSLATYSSSWLRIKFDNNEIKTDDQFQGNTVLFNWPLKYYKETILFEKWIKKPISKANQAPELAISLAELYWQGLDQDFHLS